MKHFKIVMIVLISIVSSCKESNEARLLKRIDSLEYKIKMMENPTKYLIRDKLAEWQMDDVMPDSEIDTSQIPLWAPYIDVNKNISKKEDDGQIKKQIKDLKEYNRQKRQYREWLFGK